MPSTACQHHHHHYQDEKNALEHCDENYDDDGGEKPVNFLLWQSLELKLFFLLHHVGRGCQTVQQTSDNVTIVAIMMLLDDQIFGWM